jgi:multiple sugar transport system substrate-binding protein
MTRSMDTFTTTSRRDFLKKTGVALGVAALPAHHHLVTTPTASGPTVSYWHLWTDAFYGGLQDKLTAAFNATNPGFTVKPYRNAGGDQKVILSITSGQPPDVWMMQSAPIDKAVIGALQPLDSYIASSKVIHQSDFFSSTWNTGVFRGHVYAIPYDFDTVSLYWNKDLLKKAGLDPETPPATWDELQRYAEKLTIKDKKGNLTQVGFSPTLLGFTTAQEMWGWALGGRYWDYAQTKPTLTDPANVKALQWEVDWVKHFGGAKQLDRFSGSLSSLSNFYGTKVAMWMAESYYLSYLYKYVPSVKHIGVAPFGVPRPDTRHPFITGNVDGNMIAIPTGSKNAAAAWKFIEWTCSTGIRRWATAEGDLGARKDTMSVRPSFLPSNLQNDYQVFTHLQPEALYNQGSPIDGVYNQALTKAIYDATHGTAAPLEALQTAQNTCERALRKALLHFH